LANGKRQGRLVLVLVLLLENARGNSRTRTRTTTRTSHFTPALNRSLGFLAAKVPICLDARLPSVPNPVPVNSGRVFHVSWLPFLCALVTFPSFILLHECGHYLAGSCLGLNAKLGYAETIFSGPKEKLTEQANVLVTSGVLRQSQSVHNRKEGAHA